MSAQRERRRAKRARQKERKKARLAEPVGIIDHGNGLYSTTGQLKMIMGHRFKQQLDEALDEHFKKFNHLVV